jgi:hypothetical protein
MNVLEEHDVPIVLAYNGIDHYAPTKPIRNEEVAVIRGANVYQAGGILQYMLKRMVHERMSDDERKAWHELNDQLKQSLPVFRPRDESLVRGYEGPLKQQVLYRVPRHTETRRPVDASDTPSQEALGRAEEPSTSSEPVRDMLAESRNVEPFHLDELLFPDDNLWDDESSAKDRDHVEKGK